MVSIFCLPLIAVVWGSAVSGSDADQPHFLGDLNVESMEGDVTLQWEVTAQQEVDVFEAPEGLLSESTEALPTYVVQSSLTADFRKPVRRYAGPDRATYVSGLADGQHFFRVQVEADGATSDWSETKIVTVKHQKLSLAYGLMALGGFVFVTTVAFVLVMHQREADP